MYLTLLNDLLQDKNDVNIYTKEDSYLLKFKVPGFSKEDINISTLKDVLSIECTNEEKVPEGYKAYKEYNPTNSCKYKYTFPHTIDKINADLKDGILSIMVDKPEKEQPVTIKIN